MKHPSRCQQPGYFIQLASQAAERIGRIRPPGYIDAEVDESGPVVWRVDTPHYFWESALQESSAERGNGSSGSMTRRRSADCPKDRRDAGGFPEPSVLSQRGEVGKRCWKRYGIRRYPDDEGPGCIGLKDGFGHMCLVLPGTGDTAIVPSVSFLVRVYAVMPASVNVITPGTRDPEKFFRNMSCVCESNPSPSHRQCEEC